MVLLIAKVREVRSVLLGAPQEIMSPQAHFSVIPISPGTPPEKSTTCKRSLYPSGRSWRFQNSYISLGSPVKVSSHPASRLLLIARPRSVQRVFGKRMTCTSVSPFFTARWIMTATRFNASSSETPDGAASLLIRDFFSASTFAWRRRAAVAFSASASATCSITCFADGKDDGDFCAAMLIALSIRLATTVSSSVAAFCPCYSSSSRTAEGAAIAKDDPLASRNRYNGRLLQLSEHARDGLKRKTEMICDILTRHRKLQNVPRPRTA